VDTFDNWPVGLIEDMKGVELGVVDYEAVNLADFEVEPIRLQIKDENCLIPPLPGFHRSESYILCPSPV